MIRPPYHLGALRNAVLFDLHNGKKSESNPCILKQNFQELQSRFSDYQHVFTDGSKDSDKVGCAYVSKDAQQTLRLPDGFPCVLNFPPCRGPGGSIPTGNVASLVSSNCPLEDRCSKDPICSKCGQTAEHSESRCTNELHCVNCGEKHSANSKECRIWHKEKEILRIKFTRNISFVEARKLLEAPTPILGISYANITQSSMKKVSVVDTATQTDPIIIIDSAQSSPTNTNSQTEELQRQKVQTNNATGSQTKTPIEEKKNRGWPEKSHH